MLSIIYVFNMFYLTIMNSKHSLFTVIESESVTQ